MRVALLSTFAAIKNEPLHEMVGRVRQAFLDAGLGEPAIRFKMIGSSQTTSATDISRVLKRHPEMERFLVIEPIMPGSHDVRMLSNSATGEPADYSTLEAIAAGVPRSYPLNSVALHFYSPVFGERMSGLPKLGHSLPGVMLTDNRSAMGRKRALLVYTVVDAKDDDKKLPPNPPAVDEVVKACGKVRRTEQVRTLAPDGRTALPSIPPKNAEAVKVIVADYRSRLKEVVELAMLPPVSEARSENPGVLAGPRKPALETAFKPMGYSCRGGTGEFYLTRRSSGNLTVELYLDVGTWSHSVSAIFRVMGAGFKASLVIPVTGGDAPYAQYPIGDAFQWQKIVENLAAMVRELDRVFVPEIEQAAGPSPAWYQPSS